MTWSVVQDKKFPSLSEILDEEGLPVVDHGFVSREMERAHLISAAPAMRDALSEAEECLEELRHDFGLSEMNKALIPIALNAVRSAIKKARGES